MLAKILGVSMISIHALREEGDLSHLFFYHKKPISIHALREEGDAERSSNVRPLSNFYPRPPRGGRRFPGSMYYVGTYGFLSTPSARRATR